MVGRFIAGIGALIMHPIHPTYLLLKRSADKDFGAYAWECVTGRVDQGESYEQALHREVHEEIGVNIRPEFIIGTSHFYRGAAVADNELLGVVYACSTTTPDAVRLSSEHSDYAWLTAADAIAMLSVDKPSDQWLRTVLERAELMRHHLPAALRDILRVEGFETDVNQRI